MLPNPSLVTEFLGNAFTNFIFKKFLSHEALVTELQLPVTVKRSFFCSYKWQNCSSDIGSFDSVRSKFFAIVISRFKSFSLNEYDTLIFQVYFW